MSKVKVGIVGYDTSHSHVFPLYIRDHHAPEHPEFKDIEFAYGWPGDPATSVHPDNVQETFAKVRELGMQECATIEELVEKSDVIFLESVNGWVHREQAEKILPAGKPTYIDKPFANTYEDAVAMVELARRHQTPCWHSSSLRFEPVMCAAIQEAGEGLFEADVYGPTPEYEKGRGVFYYGIHTAEMLSRVMGRGLETVRTTAWEKGEMIVCRWADGRMGTFRGRRDIYAFGGTVQTPKGAVPFQAKGGFYEAFTLELGRFCLSGEPYVPLEDTLEVIALLEAAERSKEAGGEEVRLDSFR